MYSSPIFEIKSIPIPDPVPPPNEWHTWNPKPPKNKKTHVITKTFFKKLKNCGKIITSKHYRPISHFKSNITNIKLERMKTKLSGLKSCPWSQAPSPSKQHKTQIYQNSLHCSTRNPLGLKFRVTAVVNSGIDVVLGTNHFPRTWHRFGSHICNMTKVIKEDKFLKFCILCAWFCDLCAKY